MWFLVKKYVENTRHTCPETISVRDTWLTNATRQPRSNHRRLTGTRTINTEDGCLETGVRCASSGIYSINRQEVLRGPSAGTVRILVRYHVSLNPALVPQLQLWHHHWLLYAQSASNLYSQAPCSHVPRRPCSTHLNTLGSDNVAPISVHEYHNDYYGYRGLRARRSVRRVCIPSSREHCAALCIISTPKKVPCHCDEKRCRVVCDPIWWWRLRTYFVYRSQFILLTRNHTMEKLFALMSLHPVYRVAQDLNIPFCV